MWVLLRRWCGAGLLLQTAAGLNAQRKTDCCAWLHTLGRLICMETEAPITTSVSPQRPHWGGKQEAGRLPPIHWASSILPSLPPSSSPPPPLSAPQRRAVLDHTARWWQNMCAGEKHREANNRRMLTCHRPNVIKLLFPLLFLSSALYARGRLVPVCSPKPPSTWGWPHLFAHQGTRRY